MSNNLTSKTAIRFFEKTGEGLTRAGTIHNRDPFAGRIYSHAPPPNLPEARNQDPERLTDTSRGTSARNVGNSSNIVISPIVLNQHIQRMTSIDDQVGGEVYAMLGEVEEMCATIFQVPATVKRIRNLCDEVKRCLGPFRGVTDDLAIKTRRIASEISDIDHGNPDEIAVSQTGTNQGIQLVTSTISRQADSMERTATTYRARASRLEQEADREQLRADNLQMQIDMALSLPRPV